MKAYLQVLFAVLLVFFGAVQEAAAVYTAVTVDTSDVVTQILAAVAPIGAIALAVLTIIAVIKTYKWVRRAF